MPTQSQEKAGDDLSTQAHRQLIGILGLSLPWAVLIVARMRPMEFSGSTQLLESVSAYYWTSAVVVFEGILSALAVFLFTYQGYDNEYRRRDRVAAIIAGAAAVCVGFFPTVPPDAGLAPSWWTQAMATTHLAAAAVLFTAFIFFSLFLFPKTAAPAEVMPRDKHFRNAIYRLCGVGMIACMIWLGVARIFLNTSIYWPEAIALELFAISWLVKGRIDLSLVAATKRIPHYIRRPQHLVKDAWNALQ